MQTHQWEMPFFFYSVCCIVTDCSWQLLLDNAKSCVNCIDLVTDDGLYNYIVKFSFFYLFFENCGTNSILASHDHNRFFIGIFEIILNFMIINMAQPNTWLYMVFHQQIYIQHNKIEKFHWRWWILSVWVFPIIGCFFCFVFSSAAKWKTKNPVVPKSIDSFHGLTYYICFLSMRSCSGNSLPFIGCAAFFLKKKDAYCNPVQLGF